MSPFLIYALYIWHGCPELCENIIFMLGADALWEPACLCPVRVSFWKGKRAFLPRTTKPAGLLCSGAAIALGRPSCLWRASCYRPGELCQLPHRHEGRRVPEESGIPEPPHGYSQSWALVLEPVQFIKHSLDNHFSARHWQILITKILWWRHAGGTGTESKQI